LLVASEICETYCPLVENVKETNRPASILNVRPAGFRNRSHVKAIAFADESLLSFAQTISAVCRLFYSFVEVPASVFFLLLFYERSKGKFSKAAAHGPSLEFTQT